MPASLFRNVLVPVASESDAEATMRSALPYLESADGTVTLIHVIEKAGGAPDKASVEQREQAAAGIFDAARAVARESAIDIRTEICYGTDVATAIIDAADDSGVSAIVFTPRGANKWIKLLTGDVALSLVSNSNIPVITLPDTTEP